MSRTITCTKVESDAHRVLDTLQRWSERFDGHHNQKREHERRPIRLRLTVHLSEDELSGDHTADDCVLDVWARNISRSGLCFIYNGQIELGNVIVALSLRDGEIEYFRSQLVRNRQVHEGFWEYGVKFIEKVNN